MASCPQRGDCPQHIRQSQEKALASTIFILRNIGPLGFLLKDESGSVSKVLIGNPHVCSCSSYQKDRDLCSHICWILIKRFKLDQNDPASFQLGMTDRDIDNLLRMSGPQPQDAPKIIKKLKHAQTPEDDDEEEDNGNLKKQKPLTDEDVCPICQENFLTKHWPITFCRYGCGNNIHIQCMKVWADHQITREEEGLVKSDKGMMVQCPYCRGQFCSLNQLKREYFHDPTRKLKWKKEAPLPPPKKESPRATAKKKSQDELRELLQNEQKEDLSPNPSVSKVMQRIPSMKLPAGSRILLDGLQCCLCLQKFQTGDRIGRLLCRHRFHRLCLVQWFTNNRPVCPIDKLPAYELDADEKKAIKLAGISSPSFVLCGLSMAGTKCDSVDSTSDQVTKSNEPKRSPGCDNLPSWGTKKDREKRLQRFGALQGSKVVGGGGTGVSQKPPRKKWELGNTLTPNFVVLNSFEHGTDTKVSKIPRNK